MYFVIDKCRKNYTMKFRLISILKTKKCKKRIKIGNKRMVVFQPILREIK